MSRTSPSSGERANVPRFGFRKTGDRLRLHYLSSDGGREFIAELLGFTEVPDAGTDSMKQALTLDLKDFEDAMQVAAAFRFRADRLVTRNLKDYRNSPIRVVSPSRFLKEVQGSGWG